MSRRKDVFNSPEYRHIEENLDDILKELEGDEETRNITMRKSGIRTSGRFWKR